MNRARTPLFRIVCRSYADKPPKKPSLDPPDSPPDQPPGKPPGKPPGPPKKYLVPTEPYKFNFDKQKLPPRTKLDPHTLELLKKVSLVGELGPKNIKTIEDAIAFADRIRQINTKGIDRLFNLLEDCHCLVRDDEVTEGFILDDLLSNATRVVEHYFVAPMGNVPISEVKKPKGQITIDDKKKD